MEIVIVDKKLTPDHINPKTPDSAGIDLYAVSIVEPTRLVRGAQITVKSGLRVSIPKNHAGLVVPRSSTGVQGFSLANTVGVIDSDYRGEIMIVIKNTSDLGDLILHPMQRIAQLVVTPVYRYDGSLKFVDELDSTERGEGGFGSTGAF